MDPFHTPQTHANAFFQCEKGRKWLIWNPHEYRPENGCLGGLRLCEKVWVKSQSRAPSSNSTCAARNTPRLHPTAPPAASFAALTTSSTSSGNAGQCWSVTCAKDLEAVKSSPSRSCRKQNRWPGVAQAGVEFWLGMDCVAQVLALELLTFGLLTWKKTHFSSRSDSLVSLLLSPRRD